MPRLSRRKFTFETVKQYYFDHGCELLSTQYENVKTPLEYRCKCGQVNLASFASFFGSKYKKCHFCAKGTPAPSKVNLGERYGKLLVLKEAGMNKHGQRVHLCRCDCGQEKIILDNCLRRGQTTCGKCKKDSTRLITLEGKIFGSLRVIKKTDLNPTPHFRTNKKVRSHGEAVWECVCSCGKSINVVSRRLRSDIYPSCGDKNCLESQIRSLRLQNIHSEAGMKASKKFRDFCRKDLIGKRFGKIKVVELINKKIKGCQYGCICICDCGNEFIVGAHRLRELGMADCGCTTATNTTKFNVVELNLVLGTLLGDGCIRKSKNLASLSISHSIQQEELVNWKYDILKRFVRSEPKECPNPGYNKLSRAKRFRTISTEKLSEINEILYGSGHKKVTEQYLSMITHPIALAVWYMDDGSCSRKSYGCLISTESFSMEEVQMLSDWLKIKWGVDGTKPFSYRRKNRDKDYTKLVLNAKARDQFFEIIRPYIIPSMEYKLAQPKKIKN